MAQQVLAPFQPTRHEDYDQLIGMNVFSREGDKLGTIKSVFHPELDFSQAKGRHYFLLEPKLMKEWFGGHDESYLPESAISSVTTEGVMLNLSEEEIKRQAWEKPAFVGNYRKV